MTRKASVLGSRVELLVVVSTFHVPPTKSGVVLGPCCGVCAGHSGCGRSWTVAEPATASCKGLSGAGSWARTRQRPQSLGPTHVRGTLLSLCAQGQEAELTATGSVSCWNALHDAQGVGKGESASRVCAVWRRPAATAAVLTEAAHMTN
jgi:hypothetical protein